MSGSREDGEPSLINLATAEYDSEDDSDWMPEGEREDDGTRSRLVPESDEELHMEEEGGGLISLEDLAATDHPCLASGEFSIFHSKDVEFVTDPRDLGYDIDLDGLVIMSKHLSTFRIGRYGEARAYTKGSLVDGYDATHRSKLFQPLPSTLSDHEQWMPGFNIFPDSHPNGSVMVIFRPKDTACATDVEQWRVNEKSLIETWMTTVLIPAVDSLPLDSRTRLNNASHTCLSTGVLPKYVRIYGEDVEELDGTLPRTTAISPLDEQLSWFFVFVRLGQRHQLQLGEELGPQSFGLEEEFDLSRTVRFSVHLAMNLSSMDPAFSLFWNSQELRRWCRGRSSKVLPLFGLSELGNAYANSPNNPNLEYAVGGARLTYVQLYTSMVKAMEQRVPLHVRPHLLTYLLGEEYISSRDKFGEVWREVDSQRTKLELLEVCHPTVPYAARVEIVLTNDDPSFLGSILHRTLARTIVVDRLLIKVPVDQFPGYVAKLVGELYDSVEAVVKGRLQGQGALATIVLCESLLSFLPSGSSKDQPHRLLKEYEIIPLGTLDLNRRIDLRPYASVKNGVLYISRPSAEKIWVPLQSLPSSARATATQMLEFLKLLKEAPATRSASARAAHIIVAQFKHDLLELRIVRHMTQFDGARIDGCVHNACKAEEYARRVFLPDDLPGTMTVKSCLRMAFELKLPELHREIAKELLKQTNIVPHATTHTRAITFSTSALTLLMSGSLSDGNISDDDAHRLVVAGTSLLVDHFPLAVQKKKNIQKKRPRLARCIRRVARIVWRRCGLSCRHFLVGISCIVAIVLADRDKIIGPRTAITSLSRAIHMNRFISKSQIEDVVRHCDEASDQEASDGEEESE